MQKLDHLVYATPDLNKGIKEIEDRFGVRAMPGGKHPTRGTANALLSIGNEEYLEIIGPDPDRDGSNLPDIFGLSDLRSSRLVTWVVRTEDLEGMVQLALAHGIRVGSILSGSRIKPDGTVLTWRFTDPSAFVESGIFPFFIDWGSTPHPSKDAPAICRLMDLRAEHPNPENVAEKLRGMKLNLPVRSGKMPALIATFETVRGTIEIR